MTGIGICMFAPFVGVVGGTSIVQRLRAGAIARRDLRPTDWQNIWPELAGQAQAAIKSEAMEATHG